MAMDGVMIDAIVHELSNELAGGRVDKVRQPEKDEILITIRNNGKNNILLLSASPAHPRAHLSWQKKEIPQKAPMFCMILRKHLGGTRLESITQPEYERIIEFSFAGFNEMGDNVKKRLIIEIMARHSNIILVDENNKVIDSARRVTADISSVRQILPGIEYASPPSQGKHNPKKLTSEKLSEIINSCEYYGTVPKIISSNIMGISPTTANEILVRAEVSDTNEKLTTVEKNKIIQEFISFFDMIEKRIYSPSIFINNTGMPKDFFPFLYRQYPEQNLKMYGTLSLMLEDYYLQKDKQTRLAQRTNNMGRVLKNNIDRCDKKYSKQLREKENAENADKYKLYGELLTAFSHMVTKGSKWADLPNYYDEDRPLNIPLDESKSPIENAKHYYKKYAKAKNALKVLNANMEDSLNEKEYLLTLQNHLKYAEKYSEIEEIRLEMMENGYLRPNHQLIKKAAKQKKRPMRFISDDGVEIFVGKNNYQNDELTLRMAEPNDIWLHTKNIPGSHVLIKAKLDEVSDETLTLAAELCVYYSKARESSHVPVDYCPKKNVKKPNGAKPGMVIYDNYFTIYVTADIDKIESLNK